MLRRIAPGVAIALIVAGIAVAVGAVQTRILGRAVIEPIVVAIVIGMAVRTAIGTRDLLQPGIRFVANRVLEVAVCLLGATMEVTRLFASGPLLALGIVLLVCAAMASGYAVSRLAGLSPTLSILVASGNAICGNSAIAAVAPVIGANREDVAASIALTAVFGVGVVLLLPLFVPLLALSDQQYGMFTGLTVYSVPQVVAAAFAVSSASGQIATVVKLARVLMLGPIVAFLAVRFQRKATARVPLARLVPWFVAGFVVLAALRSSGALDDRLVANVGATATGLTIAAMAALGLSVDVRAVKAVGARVIVAVACSLVVLMVLALTLVALLTN